MKTPTRKKLKEIENRGRIKQMVDSGLSLSQISRQLGVSRSTVQRWASRDPILNKKAPNRPSKVTNSVEKKIEDQIRDKVGVGTRKVGKCLNAEFESAGSDRKISRPTIQRYLKTTDWGSIVRNVSNKPLLSQKNISDRLRF